MRYGVMRDRDFPGESRQFCWAPEKNLQNSDLRKSYSFCFARALLILTAPPFFHSLDVKLHLRLQRRIERDGAL